MKTYVLILSIAYIILGSCTNSLKKTSGNEINADSLLREKLRYTVLTDMKEIHEVIDGSKILWKPTSIQLQTIESIVIQAIGEKNKNGYYKNLSAEKFRNYYKQYVCYIDKNGDSLVYLNAFCVLENLPVIDANGKASVHKFDWQHQMMFVLDGGDCYWNIVVNLTKRKYLRFSVNGVA